MPPKPRKFEGITRLPIHARADGTITPSSLTQLERVQLSPEDAQKLLERAIENRDLLMIGAIGGLAFAGVRQNLDNENGSLYTFSKLLTTAAEAAHKFTDPL